MKLRFPGSSEVSTVKIHDKRQKGDHEKHQAFFKAKMVPVVYPGKET